MKLVFRVKNIKQCVLYHCNLLQLLLGSHCQFVLADDTVLLQSMSSEKSKQPCGNMVATCRQEGDNGRKTIVERE